MNCSSASFAALMGRARRRSGVKWDSPPLWPVAAPSLLGFITACLPYLTKIPNFTEGSLLAPFGVVAFASLALLLAPDEIGSKPELIAGTWVAMLVAFLPQLVFYVWFIPVILFWLAQSIYLWKSDYPAFRIGIWIGFGAVSGLYLGGFFAHYFL
jgi:hypothetical protein